MKMTIKYDNATSQVLIGEKINTTLRSFFTPHRKVLVVKDVNVPSFHLDGLDVDVFTLESGEQAKSFDNFLKIQTYLLEHNFNRNDLIISLGGGVCGDLTAFVASTYKRGIEFINIPTTTLSMIDSSIGGKTAINFLGVKNVIGTFYQPSHVIIDFSTLSSLPRRHFYAGLVEALKAALLAPVSFLNLFDNIEENLEKIIIKSLEFKADIVKQDEHELHLRKILNFGHTIGHAIESISQHQVLHGEAVGIGMLAMIKNPQKKEKVMSILQNQLHQQLDYPITTDLLPMIYKDKKSNGDTISIITLDDTYHIEEVTYQQLNKYLGGE